MEKTRTDSAVGKVLAYDTTLITKTKSSTLLNRGHTITRNDVERLKDSGVYYVWTNEGDDELVYEWDISMRVAKRIADQTTDISPGKHGIVFLMSKKPGIVKVDSKKLVRFNLNQKVLLITKNGDRAVGEGETVAAIDVIPLAVEKKEMRRILDLTAKGMVRVSPFKLHKVGLVITGTEIFEGRKRDQYFRIINKKCKRYGWKVIFKKIVPDDEELEKKAIIDAREKGAEAIIITGGMSVDPTDLTPHAVKALGAEVIAYGVPMKPTTMTMVAIWDGLPILGISAGGIHYSEFNSIDLLFTILMAGEIPSRKDIAKIGEGGIFWNYEPH